MGIFWFVIGAIAGMALAWHYLNQKCEERLAERNREIDDLKSQLSSAQKAAKTELLPSSPAQPDETDPSQTASHQTTQMDDLTRIKGIGPVLKEKLNKFGITTFQQIAEFDDADIDRINEVLDFPGRIEREKWVEQAKALISEN